LHEKDRGGEKAKARREEEEVRTPFLARGILCWMETAL
jgi:hypothetical protein